VVRILKSDPSGTIFINGGPYTAVWWGTFNGVTIEPNNRGDGNAGGQATFTGLGLASVLEQITINSGWLLPATGGTAPWIDPGYLPPFNGAAKGDRSATTVTIAGQSVYIHDLNTVGAGHLWTARQIMDLLLAGAARPQIGTGAPSGWRWVVADPDNCLSFFTERLDLNGLSLLQAINTVICARRGLTWRLTVTGDTATINVRSGSDIAITVGSFSLPASSFQDHYTAAGNPWAMPPSVTEDNSSEYDIIEVRGARPWVGVSIYYDGTAGASLQKGWAPTQETAPTYGWNANPKSSGTDIVWRKFLVNSIWDGLQYNGGGAGLRTGLTKDDSGAYTGDRFFVPGNTGAIPPSSIFGMERELPASLLSPDASSFNQNQWGDDRLGPRQPPVLVMGSPGAFVDYSQLGFTVQCGECPPHVIVDDGQFGTNTANILGSGGQMILSVGMRENQPLRVSYVFPPSTWTRALPRVKMIDVPYLEQWTCLGGTVTGVDSSKNLVTLAQDLVIRDDTPQLQQILALAVACYGYPIVNAKQTEMNAMYTDTTLAPGSIFSGIVTGLGTVPIRSVIIRRSWNRVVRDGVDQWDTTWETGRILPDVESVI
jgi:hypothetical protein